MTPAQKYEATKLLTLLTTSATLHNIKARWLDEREYEDFAEYRKVFGEVLFEHGYTMHKLGKSFTFTATCNGVKLEGKLGARSVSVRVLA